MKKIYTLLALTISFSMNAQVSTVGTTASGNYSTAMGYDTTASGEYSTAMGQYTEASGDYSTAMGVNTTASGISSTAMGENTEASGDYSTAMGYGTTASGNRSTAMGTATTASGFISTAMGGFTTASDRGSLVIGQYNLLGSTVTNSSEGFSTENTAFVIGNGYEDSSRSDALTVLFDGTTNIAGSVTATSFIGDGSQLTNLPSSSPFSLNTTSGTGIQSPTNTASGNYSTAMGTGTSASGYVSTAMGTYTIASDRNSLVIGQYNLLGSTVTNSSEEFSEENTAFVIGNGELVTSIGQINRSDALTVLFDGTTTIAGDLSINSDARLKANIISLGSTLAKVLQIDGKSYTMKKDENKKQKIGVLAQDIEKVFPELVSESNGVKSVNYQGLVPVLINALKEQDAKMNEQQTEIDTYRDEVSELKEMVQALVSRE